MTADSRREFTDFYDATWGRTVVCAYAIAGDLGAPPLGAGKPLSTRHQTSSSPTAAVKLLGSATACVPHDGRLLGASRTTVVI